MLLILWNKGIQGWKWLLLLFRSIISTTKSYKQPYWQWLQCFCYHTCFVNLLLTKQGKAHVPFLSLEVNQNPAWSLVMDNSCLQHIILWHLVRKERESKLCWRTRKAVLATRSYSSLKCLLSAQCKRCRLMLFSVPHLHADYHEVTTAVPRHQKNSAVASSLLRSQSWCTLVLYWWPV